MHSIHARNGRPALAISFFLSKMIVRNRLERFSKPHALRTEGVLSGLFSGAVRSLHFHILLHRFNNVHPCIEATNNAIKLIFHRLFGFRNKHSLNDLEMLVCSSIKVPLPNLPRKRLIRT